MIRKKIVDLIQKSIKELQKEKKLAKFKIPEVQVEKPERKECGDYATNIALRLKTKSLKKPTEIAKNLKEKLWRHKNVRDMFEKIKVVEPGFINFFLSEEYLQKQVKEILKKGDKFTQLEIGKNKKVNIEFISANPTGPLHIGNGRGAFFGDCLANVLEKAGFKVIREYYINDAEKSRQIETIKDTVSKVADGITSTEFPTSFEQLPYYNDYLKEKILKLKTGNRVITDIQKDIKNFIEKELKIKFDNWVSEEKDLYQKKKVDKIKNWLEKRKLVYKKDGAVWLKTSKYGDTKDWVIIRETGEPTYLLSDIVYHKDKFDRKFDKIINIWGADHQGHVSKIKAAAKMLGFKGELNILISQLVRLKKGKISKRKGEIVTLEWLINEVELDAARFFYLMKSLNTQMEFDVELAKQKSEKSPVYYVQYANARIHSILTKSKIKNQKSKVNFKLLIHPKELELIKRLIKFPEVIEDTARDYQVQRIPKYAIDLATAFHQFYRDCRVLTEDKNLRVARLSLIGGVKIVLKNTLDLMGVSAPKRM